MPKQRPARRAEDLWVVGTELSLDDGRGEPVRLWIQKLNPIEMSGAMRRANAARAKLRSIRLRPDTDEYQDLQADVDEWESRDAMIAYLEAEELNNIAERVEAEHASEGEWAEDDYLAGLRDAWTGPDGLALVYAADPTDPEAARVFGELERFAAECEAAGTGEREALRARMEATADQDLRERVFEQVIRYRSTSAWVDELHRQETFYAVRQCQAVVGDDGLDHAACDHSKRYFATLDQVDSLQGPALRQFRDTYDTLMVDPAEGKDSGGTPASSDSSDSLGPATEASSSLAAATP